MVPILSSGANLSNWESVDYKDKDAIAIFIHEN